MMDMIGKTGASDAFIDEVKKLKAENAAEKHPENG